MSYQSDRNALTRHALNIVELEMDTTITDGGKEYLCDGLVPHGQHFWPVVEYIDWIPTRAAKEGGLGYFGDVVIRCRDFPWPAGAGSYFGRLLASNPYYLNRVLKIHVGFYKAGDTFSFSNFQERRYFIKKIIGPDQNHQIRIEASDVLSLLKESEIPKATSGNLNAALNSTYTGSINIQDNTGFSSGYAIIDDEIVSYSGITGGDSITISARAQAGSTADSHDADAPVRHIYHYNGNVVNCIRDIIENYTDIDHANYLPDADWNTERDSFLSSETVDVWITEPVKADTVISDLGKQTYLNVWWDDEAQDIKLKAIGPTLNAVTEWNDTNHILDSKITLTRDQRAILTAAWIYFTKIDASKKNDAKNFENVYIQVDTAAETGLGTSKIKKLMAEYVTSSATASKVSNRLIAQNAKPVEVVLQVDAKDSDVLVGDAVDLNSTVLQGTDGLPELIRMRVIERAPSSYNRYTYKLIFSGVEVGSRYPIVGPNALADYTSASTIEKNKYGWLAATGTELMSNSDNPYLIL